MQQSDKELDGNCAEIRVSGQKGTELQRKEQRNRNMASNKEGKEEWVTQNTETEGTWMDVIERKAAATKKKES